MSTTPIADHALLSDCHSSALVDKEGSVEWLTFPRFDSPSIMGRLLGETAKARICACARLHSPAWATIVPFGRPVEPEV